MRANGRYSDGEVGGSTDATIDLVGHQVVIQSTDSQSLGSFDLDDVEIVAPIGRGPWTLCLPDRAEIVFRDDDFGRRLLAASGKSDGIGVLERGWTWAIVALFVAIAGTWVILEKGVPVAAKYVAESVPQELERSLQQESIDVVDGWIFEASELPLARQQTIQGTFDEIIAEDPAYADYRLIFRSAPSVGPNAFAMPGGTVLLTDELVGYAKNDDEITAVLAHEIGHLAQRHSLRILLQDSATALFIAGVTGDLTNITALSASIPTVLMRSKYSRQFEREADEFAFEVLERRGLDPQLLRDLLSRVEDSAGGDADIPGWLSTHPPTEERVPTPE